MDAGGGHWTPRNWSYRWLQAAMWEKRSQLGPLKKQKYSPQLSHLDSPRIRTFQGYRENSGFPSNVLFPDVILIGETKHFTRQIDLLDLVMLRGAFLSLIA